MPPFFQWIITFIVGAVVALTGYLFRSQRQEVGQLREDHEADIGRVERRVVEIERRERDYVSRTEMESLVTRIEMKMDAGFKELRTELFRLLQRNRPQ